MTNMLHPHANKIREALIRAKTERQHGETMEEALVRELAAQRLVIVEMEKLFPLPADYSPLP